MRPSTIWYTLKQGIKNIKRNFMFSIASIITMAACIFLFGIFFSIVNNVNTLAHKVEEDVPITGADGCSWRTDQAAPGGFQD